MSLALLRQEADSAAAASQSETAALISRITRESEAQVATAREETAASQVRSNPARLQQFLQAPLRCKLSTNGSICNNKLRLGASCTLCCNLPFAAGQP